MFGLGVKLRLKFINIKWSYIFVINTIKCPKTLVMCSVSMEHFLTNSFGFITLSFQLPNETTKHLKIQQNYRYLEAARD